MAEIIRLYVVKAYGTAQACLRMSNARRLRHRIAIFQSLT
jgi:hypothetical protein